MQTLFSILGVIAFIIYIIWGTVLRLKIIASDKLVFRRYIPFDGNTVLHAKDIRFILHATLTGKTLSYYIKTGSELYQDSNTKINHLDLLQFAMKNDIPFAHDEAYHGGGLSILFQSESKPEHEFDCS